MWEISFGEIEVVACTSCFHSLCLFFKLDGAYAANSPLPLIFVTYFHCLLSLGGKN